MFNRKSQTATEYLIILAVVIVIALIVIGVLGGIPSIGGGASESTAKASLKSAKVGIVSYAVSDMDVKLNVLNNNPDSIKVNLITIGEVPCYSVEPFVLSPGSVETVTCTEGYESISSKSDLRIAITWKDLVADATYVQNSTDYSLVGSVSEVYLETVKSHANWSDPEKGCWDGTTNFSPNPICTCVDLNKVRNQLTWDYELQNSIDFKRCKNLFNADYTQTGNAGAGWVPIDGPFVGTFDGNSFIIKNLFISRSGTDYVGLFEDIALNVGTFGTISNLKVVNGYVEGNEYAGGLVGDGDYGLIINSSYVGVVSGDYYPGGLAGHGYSINITNTYASGSVLGDSGYAGGLVGEGDFGDIANSFFSGYVGGSYPGGLVGLTFGGGFTSITNSYWNDLSGGVTSCTSDYTGHDNPGECENCDSFFDCKSKAGLS